MKATSSRRRTLVCVVAGLVACQPAATEPERILPSEVPGASPQPPVVHRIAYSNAGQISTIRDDGAGLKRVSDPGTPNYSRSPVWSPAGPNRIAFLKDQVDGNEVVRHLRVMLASGAGVLDLTPSGLHFVSQAIWSPDGNRLAFFDGPASNGLSVVNADGTRLAVLVTGVFQDGAPAWSPDGQRIVFFRNDNPLTFMNERGIWSVKPNGTGRLKLRNVATGSYSRLQFSPDGTKLAMCRDSTSPPSRLRVMNANGTGLVDLSLKCDGISTPQWSPDGAWILTINNGAIWRVAPNGGLAKNLTPGLPPNTFTYVGHWSRQGNQVAYVSDAPGGGCRGTPTGVWLMSPDGSGKRRVTPCGEAVNYHLSWGP